MTLIAQISDTHIRLPGQLIEGRVDTFAYLSVCVDRINALPQRPHLTVASGDLADSGSGSGSGSAAEYRHIKTNSVACPCPIASCPATTTWRAHARSVRRHLRPAYF